MEFITAIRVVAVMPIMFRAVTFVRFYARALDKVNTAGFIAVVIPVVEMIRVIPPGIPGIA